MWLYDIIWLISTSLTYMHCLLSSHFYSLIFLAKFSYTFSTFNLLLKWHTFPFPQLIFIFLVLARKWSQLEIYCSFLEFSLHSYTSLPKFKVWNFVLPWLWWPFFKSGKRPITITNQLQTVGLYCQGTPQKSLGHLTKNFKPEDFRNVQTIWIPSNGLQNN